MSSSGPSLGFLGNAPELKSLALDRGFDRVAREIVGRGIARRDRADRGPGTMVLRQPAAHKITREGAQIPPGFRLEDIDPHGFILSAARNGTRLIMEHDLVRKRVPTPD